MKVFISTLGCKVNQYESQAMLGMLCSEGYQPAEAAEQADVIILNSCTVTGTSDQKVRQTLHRLRRKNRDAVLVLTGCMPQAFPEEAAVLETADIVLGNARRREVSKKIQEFLSIHQRIVDIPAHVAGEKFEAMRVSEFHERTRAFVKIQDGCNRFCSYCIIPMARGRVRSKPLEELREELEQLGRQGYREVVLVGINLSAYGQEWGLELSDAVEAACAVEGIQRVRLGSLEPDRMTDEAIVRLSAQKKLCPQFHLSLQSGCDKTLKMMNRRYTSAEYERMVVKLRECFENAAITTDIMVGFPMESEEDFQSSLSFIRRIGFAKAHVFAYSPRPGTKAAEMDGQIPRREKERRSHRMMETTEKTRNAFLSAQVGRKETVLFENEVEPRVYEGFTENYTPVRVAGGASLKGKLLPVELTELCGDYCIGTPIEKAMT